jgi:hypothetical protein
MVLLNPKGPPEPEPNGKMRTFRLIRSYVVLVLGAVLVVYGAAPPVDPAIFGFGGALLGAVPMVRAQER